MKTIAILGANGRLANEAMKAFYKAGYNVSAVTRNGELREGIKVLRVEQLML